MAVKIYYDKDADLNLLKGKKVAIIGSGPAGMSAAYFLAKMNFSITIFDAAHEPGGLLRYAIPELRLPQKVLDEQFSQLKWAGVEIQTDAVFGRTLMIDELFMGGFSAVLLATGASLPFFSDLPGSSLSGVYYDMEFLYQLQTTGKENILQASRQQGIPAAKTIIVGGGATAFDVARLSLRLGSEVRMVFEDFEQASILKESKEEGVKLLDSQVLEIVGDDNGFVRGLKCRKGDEEPTVLEAQTVIIANGRQSNDFLKQCLPQLKWDEDGSLWIDAKTGMTSMEKVFACLPRRQAGGSAVGSVVDSIAGGKAAAQKIIQYL